MTQLLQSVARVGGQALTGSVTLNIFLSIFLGVSLKRVWMLMNTLQILVSLPLLNFNLPSNALFLFQALVDLSNFNFLPKEKITGILKSIGLAKSVASTGKEPSDSFQVMDIF